MITIFESKKRLAVLDYSPELDAAIKNFSGFGSVKVFKGKVYVVRNAFPYFLEKLRRTVVGQIKIITPL